MLLRYDYKPVTVVGDVLVIDTIQRRYWTVAHGLGE